MRYSNQSFIPVGINQQIQFIYTKGYWIQSKNKKVISAENLNVYLFLTKC